MIKKALKFSLWISTGAVIGRTIFMLLYWTDYTIWFMLIILEWMIGIAVGFPIALFNEWVDGEDE